MANNAMFKVVSYGGMCKDTREEKFYVSAETAIVAIMADTWNEGHRLYKMTFTAREDGRLEVAEEYMERPETNREREHREHMARVKREAEERAAKYAAIAAKRRATIEAKKAAAVIG